MVRDRRNFMRTTSLLAAGSLILPSWACKNAAEKVDTAVVDKVADAMVKGDLEKFGVQLYTLRDDLPKDPKGVLKKVADYGFTNIESYDGKDGMFHGMTHTEFKAYMDELGMTLSSSHVNIHKDFEQKAEQAAEIGMDYLICPYVGPQKSMDDWKKITDKFNDCGEICKKAGVKFAYHNHAYSFKAFSGMIPHDFIMDNTDPELVKQQMDIYWVVTGGADPIEYLEKYSGRFTLCHVKDRLKNVPADEHSASCNLGTGSIDFPKILKVARDNGMEHFIMEQERYDDGSPLESVKAGAAYLKQFKFA